MEAMKYLLETRVGVPLLAQFHAHVSQDGQEPTNV
jgi:hypothetical protein